MERKKDSLEAVADVEPSRLFDLEGKLIDSGPEDETKPLCPAKVKIFWNARVGFVREQSYPDCGDTTRARSLSISDVGVITTVAGDWGRIVRVLTRRGVKRRSYW